MLDGHLRLKALQELQQTEVLCLIARDNDVLTYNDKVNRISVIQEHAMIRRAIEQGVTPEAIAKALDLDLKQVIGKINLVFEQVGRASRGGDATPLLVWAEARRGAIPAGFVLRTRVAGLH